MIKLNKPVVCKITKRFDFLYQRVRIIDNVLRGMARRNYRIVHDRFSNTYSVQWQSYILGVIPGVWMNYGPTYTDFQHADSSMYTLANAYRRSVEKRFEKQITTVNRIEVTF